MKRSILQNVDYRFLLGLFLLLSLSIGTVTQSMAQEVFCTGTTNKPLVPVLSLTGASDGYEKDTWYPDGRIYLPASPGNPRVTGKYREFLLPVFIQNEWCTHVETKNKYKADPIRSFQFSLFYDSSAIRAIGVQAFGPKDTLLGSEPLAKHFNLTWWDTRDTSYRRWLKPEVSQIDREKGRRITIVGTTTSDPLPNSPDEFKVLCYVRFAVVLGENDPPSTAGKTPIYVGTDTIKYNDLNIRTTAPFEKMRKYDPDVINDYPDPDIFEGLAGVNNSDETISESEPSLPGSVYLVITNNVPTIGFFLERGIGQTPQLKDVSDLNEGVATIDVLDPITVDSNSFDPEMGTRIIQIKNLQTGTRLQDLELVSDSPWLLFRTKKIGPNDCIPIRNATRKGLIPYLDYGIMGPGGSEPLDIKGQPSVNGCDIQLEVQCDPRELSLDNPNDPEKAGLYVGYITFRSNTAYTSPIRLRVTFIFFRTPHEGQVNQKRGVMLTLRNASGTVGDSCKLIFGTGHRATDGIDSLFGEHAYLDAPQTRSLFNARFYHAEDLMHEDSIVSRLPNFVVRDGEIPYGLGDWAPNDEQRRTDVINKMGFRMKGSRDIRSSDDTLESILYGVHFEADGDENYPVTIEWDTTDFLPGSQLFIHDAVNGSFFNVDMRRATPLGGNRFSYVISDPRWKEFIIEYTLPRVFRYVDEFGNPIIQPGWNFLSMPVRAQNSYYRVFYPNAINIPLLFTQNQYQEAEVLRPGYGYFIKYPEEAVDVQFPGSNIPRISPETGDVIRLYTGWNTVGSLTNETSIENLDLVDFDVNDQIFPNRFESLKKGIWAYKTDEGYVEVSSFMPGRGHWLYADAGSYLKITGGAKAPENHFYISEKENILTQSTKLVIRDNSQKSSSVYLTNNSNVNLGDFIMPPLPPQELFDVRFANDNYLDNSGQCKLMLQAVSYPVSLAIEKSDADYLFINPVNGQVYGTIQRNTGGSVIIPESLTNSVIIEKKNAGSLVLDLSNYPNPVATVSNVKFVLPEDGHVTLKLYDALGNEVKSLFDETVTAGPYDVTLDASALSSGSYICKLNAGSQSLVRTVTVVR